MNNHCHVHWINNRFEPTIFPRCNFYDSLLKVQMLFAFDYQAASISHVVFSQMHLFGMEIVFGFEHRRWWWYRETNPMSLGNVAKKEIYGKSKRKTLSFVHLSRSAAGRTFPIKNVPDKRSFSAVSWEENRERAFTCIEVGAQPCETIRDWTIVGLFTQHQTFTFSQQFNAHQNRSASLRNREMLSRCRRRWWWNS